MSNETANYDYERDVIMRYAEGGADPDVAPDVIVPTLTAAWRAIPAGARANVLTAALTAAATSGADGGEIEQRVENLNTSRAAAGASQRETRQRDPFAALAVAAGIALAVTDSDAMREDVVAALSLAMVDAGTMPGEGIPPIMSYVDSPVAERVRADIAKRLGTATAGDGRSGNRARLDRSLAEVPNGTHMSTSLDSTVIGTAVRRGGASDPHMIATAHDGAELGRFDSPTPALAAVRAAYDGTETAANGWTRWTFDSTGSSLAAEVDAARERGASPDRGDQ